MTNHPDRWQLDRLIERYPGKYPCPTEYEHRLELTGDDFVYVLKDDADTLFESDLRDLLDWLADHLPELKEQP